MSFGSCLLVALLAGGHDAGTPRRFLWDVPQPLESVPVSGGAKALGVPMKLHAVKSKLGAEALFLHFRREFQAANLYIPPREGQFQMPGGRQLTGLDIETNTSYTVIFQPNPDGTTTLILGEADLEHRDPPADAKLPVYPQASHVLQSSGEGSLMLMYEAQARPEELSSFYRETLSRAGYREKDGAFVRAGEQIRVLAQGAQDGGTVYVTVIQTAAP
jgi:hypothetical protein